MLRSGNCGGNLAFTLQVRIGGGGLSFSHESFTENQRRNINKVWGLKEITLIQSHKIPKKSHLPEKYSRLLQAGTFQFPLKLKINQRIKNLYCHFIILTKLEQFCNQKVFCSNRMVCDVHKQESMYFYQK